MKWWCLHCHDGDGGNKDVDSFVGSSVGGDVRCQKATEDLDVLAPHTVADRCSGLKTVGHAASVKLEEVS